MLLRKCDAPREKMMKNQRGESMPRQLARGLWELMYKITNYTHAP